MQAPDVAWICSKQKVPFKQKVPEVYEEWLDGIFHDFTDSGNMNL